MVFEDKPTIAVMVSVINWWYGNEIIKGIHSAADEEGVNLRIFSGDILNSPNRIERERNIIYDIINEQNVDGIIVIAAVLCAFLSPEEVAGYFFRYAPLPVVGIGDFPIDLPHVVADNTKGMEAVVRHLVVHHGYRKIAFISGPMDNSEAVTRLNVFKRVMGELGLAPDPAYIVYGNFHWSSGKKMVCELLDKRKLSIEAIACANDEMAFGAYYELAERGIDIPGKIALTGFDDVHEARYAFPPFTTVRQPFFAMGQTALEMVLKRVKKVPGKKSGPGSEKMILPTELVIRKSCGCGHRSRRFKEQEKKKANIKITGKSPDLNVFDTNLIKELGTHYSLLSNIKKKNIAALYQHLMEDIRNRDSSTFYDHLRTLIYHEGITEEVINQWSSILDCFSTHIKENTRDYTILESLNLIKAEANDLIDESRKSVLGSRKVEADIKVLTYQTALERIGSCLTFDALLEALKESFSTVGMEHIYFSFYPDRQFGYPESALPIGKARLLLGFDGEKLTIYPGTAYFPINDLVPRKDFQYKVNNHFIVYPVTINSRYFGIIVMEYYDDREHIKMYGPLVERINATIWTIMQFNKVEQIVKTRTEELELANKKLAETNRALWGEMETARQIQDSLLPKNPVIEGFDIACFIQSASEVGGDYYDVIHSGDKSWLVIGDVSGHGITAGLVMMMVQTAITTLLNKCPGLTPSELLRDINKAIKNNIEKLGVEKYMTIMVLAQIDNKRFLFSGQHQDIYIYRAGRGTVEVLESRGMWIGFIDDISGLVKNDSFELEKGDTLLLYTDGITEAVQKESAGNNVLERFENDRLLDFFQKNGDKTPEQIKQVLIKELDNYICNDDVTFVLVQRS